MPKYEERSKKELVELARKKGLSIKGTKDSIIHKLRAQRKGSSIKKYRSKSKAAKFEKCVQKVKAKQSKGCASRNYRDKGCYNPWAICNSTVYK